MNLPPTDRGLVAFVRQSNRNYYQSLASVRMTHDGGV